MDISSLKRYLFEGGSPDARDHNDLSLLEHAVMVDSLPAVKILLHYGADPNVETYFLGNTLHIAIEKDASTSIITSLLLKGADPNAQDDDGQTPLSSAIFYSRSYSTISLLLPLTDLSLTDTMNQTPLHLVAQGDDIRTALELIKRGLSVYARDSHNKTPLDIAEANPHNPLMALTLRQAALEQSLARA